VQQTRARCPTTDLILSGFSQGAQVVHNTTLLLTAADSAFVNTVLLFGDPDSGLPVGNITSSKVSTACHAGDNICEHGDLVLETHLSYCHDVAAEAAFALVRYQNATA
jgi:cutinase